MVSIEDIDVYKVGAMEVEADIEGRKMRFLYNPNTNYVLMPAKVYKSEPTLVSALREHPLIDGIFNHEAVSELKSH